MIGSRNLRYFYQRLRVRRVFVFSMCLGFVLLCHASASSTLPDAARKVPLPFRPALES